MYHVRVGQVFVSATSRAVIPSALDTQTRGMLRCLELRLIGVGNALEWCGRVGIDSRQPPGQRLVEPSRAGGYGLYIPGESAIMEGV